MPPSRLAVTGTPGCGKTTLCTSLEMPSISVAELAEEHGVARAVDDMIEIDVHGLVKSLDWSSPTAEPSLVDGHLSHHLPVDGVILLRCHPDILRTRLEERGYNEAKIEDNVEFEMIGGVWFDIPDHIPVLELDSSNSSVDEIGDKVKRWLQSSMQPRRPEAVLDWLDDLA